jgi:hypothetical protein
VKQSLGLDGLDNFKRLWDMEVGFRFPKTWLWGNLGQGEIWLACKSLIKRWLGLWALDLLIWFILRSH